ncbi:class II aldolase/adducin family protein [Alloyangia pacifica]|uniref:Ribulose-5-phosphate 4-epimerase/Fuculose-1-phosphate aldolase n=1 Tax=Alloyangia pacifica TaxID=311180 RepID=A0A1I6VWZ7_9RHOB|nr:class II aldolase/adducin family protein [Alloyangia pacifica]SDI21384.1 Ribulose-5-phosphate 4-epimerase/Fuculose-1-phosphate aldolase [Alloyangia pacifica]SFT18212.1 Ribulose-5-phosphate 4-epimerase/Fuculose-1-phosphate aldolase [Alloyangia pacifica]
MSAASLHSLPETATDPAALRQDLAAAFRICHQMGWSESVGNHFSAAVSEDGARFLLNPRWQHFATIRPEDLLLLDSGDETVLDGPDAPDASAWCVHGTLHRKKPEAKVILHCHSPYATALSCLADPTVVPIDNNTARFYGRTAYDLDFGGIADAEEEGERLADSLGDKSVLVMGNHGVTVVGETVADAYEDLYFFEKAAQTLILARSSGEKLSVLSDAVAQNTADGWRAYRGMAARHFDFLKSQLPTL